MHHYVERSPETSPEAIQACRCDATRNRSFYDILWNCLATIAACTYFAIHPNIPDPEAPILKTLRIKVRTAFYALLAPEAIIMWALRQRLAASMIRKDFKELGWTTAHAFFYQMGGLVLYDDNAGVKEHTVMLKGFEELAKDGIKLPDITEDEIMDRSKRDFLSKAIVVLQTSWFVVQVGSRRAQGLVITQLELGTLAFALVNIGTYILWWDKPWGVRHPIYFNKKGERVKGPGSIASNKRFKISFGWVSTLATALLDGIDFEEYWEAYTGPFYNPISMVWEAVGSVLRAARDRLSGLKKPASQPNLSGGGEERPTVNAPPPSVLHRAGRAIGCMVKKVFLWIIGPLPEMIAFSTTNCQPGTHVEAFYAGYPGRVAMAIMLIASSAVGVLFGAIHLFAWIGIFVFPSTLQRWLWLANSLAITGIPLVFAIAVLIRLISYHKSEVVQTVANAAHAPIHYPSHYIFPIVYVIARLALIFQMFYLLRDLPPTAYSNSIPGTTSNSPMYCTIAKIKLAKPVRSTAIGRGYLLLFGFSLIVLCLSQGGAYLLATTFQQHAQSTMQDPLAVESLIHETIPKLPKRSLKRSASAASLPTPPRTRHKHKGARKSRTADGSDTEPAEGGAFEGFGSEESDFEAEEGVKRRKVDKKREEEDEEEDAFWLGPAKPTRKLEDEPSATSTPKEKAVSVEKEKAEDDSSKAASAPTSKQPEPKEDQPKAQAAPSSSSRRRTNIGALPVSPPPSRRSPRKRRLIATPRPAVKIPRLVSPPHTPTRDAQDKVKFPVRDSPDNPFLDSPTAGHGDNEEDDLRPLPGSSTRVDADDERPTITYVFRGVKAKFPNPYYDPEKKRARSPPPNSKLPMEHPDYSPDPRCVPRILFPKRAKGKGRKESDKVEHKAGEGSSQTAKLGEGPKSSERDESGASRKKDESLMSRMMAKRSLSPFEDSDGEGDDDDFTLGPIKPIQHRLESIKASIKAKKILVVEPESTSRDDAAKARPTTGVGKDKAEPRKSKEPAKRDESPAPQTRALPRLLKPDNDDPFL